MIDSHFSKERNQGLMNLIFVLGLFGFYLTGILLSNQFRFLGFFVVAIVVFIPIAILLIMEKKVESNNELAKAISNVLINAIRYSSENTTIHLNVIEDKNEINVIITDQGIGIEKEHLPFIFNDFFVVNTYSNDTKKCIGLGLPITKRILEIHKGKITVESQIEKGSTFTITLPKKS